MSGNPQELHTNERARVGLRASLLGLLLNASLAASKIVVGSLARSVSILADGINNLSDSGSVLISWFSLRMSQKPGDKDHPFGHGRIEYIGTLAIAVIILYVGIDLLKSSVQAILKPEAPQFSWLLAGVTAFSVPVKLFMWRFYLKRGKAYNISSLNAAAQDSLNDVIITSVVVLGLFVSHFFGIHVDGWLGALVSLFILWSGIKLVRENSTALIGGKPDAELGGKILDIIRKYPEITGVHDFMLHDYGPGRTMASLHAEVAADARLIEIHDVVDQAEQEILHKLGLPITIHMDPTLPPDAPGQEVKTALEQFLAGQVPPLSLHDFRIVPGKRVIKLVFDVVVPADYHDKHLDEKISRYVRSLDERYQCVIQYDRDYFSKENGGEDEAS